MRAPKHILAIRLSAMGDVAMTVPVLRAFRQQYPHVKITVVSNPFYKPFFDTIQNLNFFGVDLRHRHRGILGVIRLFNDLRKLKINAVADLHNVLRSKGIRTLFMLTGKHIEHTDKGRDEKKALVAPENKVFKQIKTMVERHADTFERLGYPIDLSKVNFPSQKKLTPALNTFAGNEEAKIWIGIAPYAQYDGKIYPEDLMKEVISGIVIRGDITLFLFGSKAEKEKLEKLRQGFTNVKIVPGAVSFEEELILMSHLDLLVSMDSGNGHLGAMLGVKVVTLWGATHPFAGFMPFNQPMENALLADRDVYPMLPTSVYGNKMVPGYENAMRTISPQSVLDKINELLAVESLQSLKQTTHHHNL